MRYYNTRERNHELDPMLLQVSSSSLLQKVLRCRTNLGVYVNDYVRGIQDTLGERTADLKEYEILQIGY